VLMPSWSVSDGRCRVIAAGAMAVPLAARARLACCGRQASRVQISTTWDGAGGIGGLFERIFAPRVLRAIYADELKRLDAYAREHRST